MPQTGYSDTMRALEEVEEAIKLMASCQPRNAPGPAVLSLAEVGIRTEEADTLLQSAKDDLETDIQYLQDKVDELDEALEHLQEATSDIEDAAALLIEDEVEPVDIDEVEEMVDSAQGHIEGAKESIGTAF